MIKTILPKHKGKNKEEYKKTREEKRLPKSRKAVLIEYQANNVLISFLSNLGSPNIPKLPNKLIT